ncbi:putative G-protein coupled receptor 34 [Carettochelys insculpta]|uniref:putative G-protein coupled receptor 34 n=1 Tax=Carettochelys insculpta TaxID=44489 RepID=UPI003EBE11EB
MMEASSSEFLTSSLYEKGFWNNQTELTRNFSSEKTNATKCLINEGSLSLAFIIFYSIIFVVGLAGNIVALFAFLRINHRRNSIQIYLLNVAIADLLLIFCLPFRISYHINKNTWILGLIFCKIVGSLFYMNMYISIVLLGLISMDRYVKINKSIQRPKILTATRSRYICCILWTIAITGLTVIVAQSVRREEYNSTMCFHYRDKHNAKMEAILNYILVIIFWIVFFLLILSYAKIAENLLKISKKRADFPNSGKYSTTARNSFIVLTIFTLCFVPYHIFRFIYITSQLQHTSCYWKEIIHKCNEIMLVLSSFNSCLDPIMYFLMSSNVRKTVLQLICRRRQGDTSMSDSVSEMKPGQSRHDTASTITTHLSFKKKTSLM